MWNAGLDDAQARIKIQSVQSLSHVWLFATPWTVAYPAPQSMEFSRQEYWSGLPFPFPGDLPDPGIEPGSPSLQADALLSEPPEAGQVVWYSHLLKNFPQFIVIHRVKGFGIVNKAEIAVFLDSLAFSMIQQVFAIWSLVPLPFLKPAWTTGSSRFMYCWRLSWKFFSISLLACEISAIVW